MAKKDKIKPKCIFVIGTESSGSTFMAKTISKAVNGPPEWNGRGFNYQKSGDYSDHLESGQTSQSTGVLVCHRSLPYGLKDPQWPPIEIWNATYDAWYVICTRDNNIAQISAMARFGRTLKETASNHAKAKIIIEQLLSNNPNCFIWSYETFIFLKGSYLERLYRFLDIETNYFPEDVIDGNERYTKVASYRSTFSMLRKRLRHFFFSKKKD
ncbi:MAG: hypothetical protein AAF502_06820 [Bacteroidota bacterium]